jgi:hypothetical protein
MRWRRLLRRRRVMLMRLAACLSGDRALALFVRRCEVCAKMAGTGRALMLEIARNGGEDWRRTISFVSDTTAAGGCIFVGREGGRQHAIQ